MSLLGFPIPRKARQLFARTIECGRFEVFGGMTDDRDFLKRADLGDFQSRLVAKHRRFTLVKWNQFEFTFERSFAERVLGNKKPQ